MVIKKFSVLSRMSFAKPTVDTRWPIPGQGTNTSCALFIVELLAVAPVFLGLQTDMELFY
jgi:hypothetical protein